MSTSTEDEVATAVDLTVGDTPAAAHTQTADAVRWFEIVEVPEVGFRAFVRLPNDFQHKDIREKGMAAKARRIRQLKMPETDAYEVLEAELDALAAAPEAHADMVAELVQRNYWRDRERARMEVEEDERFETIRQDQERFRDMQELDPDDRPEDEWQELVQHLGEHAQAVEQRLDEMQKPQREALEGQGIDDLVDQLRASRIDNESRRAFMDTYSFWQMFTGTFTVPEDFDPHNPGVNPKNPGVSMPRQRYFKSEDEFRDADPMVVLRLSEAFQRLEGNIGAIASAGNS